MKKAIEFDGRRLYCEYARPNVKLNPLEFSYITRVINGSPAKKLGVKPGDALLKLNGKPAAKANLGSLYLESESIEYVIFREKESKGMHIKAANLPLGIEVEHTSEKIIKMFDNVDGETEQLIQLWQRGDWGGLLVSSKDMTLDNMPILKWTFKILRRSYEGPAILTKGIALYEQEKFDEAKVIIEKYYNEYINLGTIKFHALCFYYMGLIEQQQGNAEQAQNLWSHSEYYCHCPVLQKRLHELGVSPTNKSPWQLKKFPVNFDLMHFDESKRFRLDQMLEQLDEKQLLFIAGLPGYRTNNPLDNYMLEYEKLMALFPDYCGSFLVITEIKDSSDIPDDWFEIENRLIDKGLPIEFLFDEGRKVVDVLDQNGSPNIYVLNKQGLVINKPGDDFKVDDIWACLAYEFGDVFVDCEPSTGSGQSE